MTQRILSSHSTHEWHSLVSEAQQSAGIRLEEELESYLVFMLMRYTDKPEMASSVLALDYLNGSNSLGQLRHDRMRDVGDQCLLYSGLFPERAERRRVRISYYVDLGTSAYHTAADATQKTISQLFASLASQFVIIMDTLQAMRGISGEQLQLAPIMAFELWQDTGSQHALSQLKRKTSQQEHLIVSTESNNKNKH
ncbi:MAG: hypothetical protein OEY52_08015 [Gammaproteobacteria bacterium]|nr:hypothetical protein [Gammaproteobacteria bacterium]